jgi:hypothetical protein
VETLKSKTTLDSSNTYDQVKRVELNVYKPWKFLKFENAKQDGIFVSQIFHRTSDNTTWTDF